MLPCFNYLWDLFYIDKVKTIPSNIGDLLTDVGLAFLIMDDGGLGSNGTLNLHTDSYTLTEVNLLIDVCGCRLCSLPLAAERQAGQSQSLDVATPEA